MNQSACLFPLLVLAQTASLWIAQPATAQVSADEIPDLVAWWRAEGNALDAVGLSNGTLVGGSSFAAGFFGTAFEFDGTSGYIDVGTGTNLDFGTNDFSISVWINLDTLSIGATDGIREILHKVIGTVNIDSKNYFLEYFASTGQLRFAIGQDGVLQNDFRVSATLVAGQWHHVAAVRSGDTNLIYLDGLLLGSQTSGTAVDTGTGGNTRIGHKAVNGVPTPRYFDGRIDEIAVYNRALTSADILQLATPAAVPSLDPRGWLVLTSLLLLAGRHVLRSRMVSRVIPT